MLIMNHLVYVCVCYHAGPVVCASASNGVDMIVLNLSVRLGG